MSYDHKSIDPKWQQRWEEAGIFHAKDGDKREKYYVLVEFPYPSAEGLHAGHPRSYTALDIVARKKRMEGKNVLYPIGWDAFGLPTENYAIKTGQPPAVITKQNTDNFRRQLKSIGFSFDWSREVNTTDPAYYKWTQWMFNQFFKAGLAYKAKVAINWCPKDKIGLANEEAVGGVCERCGTSVEKREKEQWMIAITKYADRLLEDLKTVDYLPKIKKQQEDWIGRSEGLIFSSPVKDSELVLETFSAHFESFAADTFVVIAPDHPLLPKLLEEVENSDEILREAGEMTKRRDAAEGEQKEVEGIFTGRYTIDPVGNGELPIWIASFALANYGTGVVKCSAHDERDFAFAKKYGIPLKPVLMPRDIAEAERVRNGEICFTDMKQGVLTEPKEFAGKIAGEHREAIMEYAEKHGLARRSVQYKLRDWVFSRQRYWGEPIPLVHCKKDGWVAVPDDQLPVVLPEVEKYQPTDTGESPLASITDWVNTKCPQCGDPATRETDTMPNWAGSSWYFLRYVDPKNDKAFASKEALKYWMPVDLYNGGMEHTTLHLLYSRFWNKFLFDQGFVPTSEPYARRHSHGMILAEDGVKMSKSRGNVVNPDAIVQEYGADTLRVYEVFMGPFEEAVPWSTNGVVGVRRFLDRVMRFPEMIVEGEDPAVTRQLHKTIEKVTKDIEGFGFNTAVAAMMSFVNEVYAKGGISKPTMSEFLKVLVPFAPHVANNLWEAIGEKGFVEEQPWPKADAAMLIDDEVEIAVQVNGKLRGSIRVPANIGEQDLIALAKADENVAKHLTGEPKKTIVVKGKIVNFVL